MDDLKFPVRVSYSFSHCLRFSSPTACTRAMCILCKPTPRPIRRPVLSECAPSVLFDLASTSTAPPPTTYPTLSSERTTSDNTSSEFKEESCSVEPQVATDSWNDETTLSSESEPTAVAAAAALIPRSAGDGGAVKRPMNAFLLWAREQRKRVSGSNPDMSNSDVSSSLGGLWRRLSALEKLPYKKEAERLRQEHRKDHPGYYRHCPRTRPLTKDKAVVERTRRKIDELLKSPDLEELMCCSDPHPEDSEGDSSPIYDTPPTELGEATEGRWQSAPSLVKVSTSDESISSGKPLSQR